SRTKRLHEAATAQAHNCNGELVVALSFAASATFLATAPLLTVPCVTGPFVTVPFAASAAFLATAACLPLTILLRCICLLCQHH
ncbi:MAG: hypothetical protein ACKPKO_50260, partial [Candidatus Fonsibacter sp.]